MKKINIPAVIFAGGKSSRMGKDKALLPFGEFETLVEFQYRRLQKIFQEVSISWKNEKVKLDAKSIFDDEKFSKISAPAVGLYSILNSLEDEYVFILSVDSPFFEESEILRLFKEVEGGYDAIIPITENGVEPLIAIYHKRVLSKIEYLLKTKNYKLKQLMQHLNTKYVKYVDSKSFINLNYPEQYEKAINSYKSDIENREVGI